MWARWRKGERGRSQDVRPETVRLPTMPPATQSMAFHADAMRRSVQLDGPSGQVALNVDLLTGLKAVDGSGTALVEKLSGKRGPGLTPAHS